MPLVYFSLWSSSGLIKCICCGYEYAKTTQLNSNSQWAIWYIHNNYSPIIAQNIYKQTRQKENKETLVLLCVVLYVIHRRHGTSFPSPYCRQCEFHRMAMQPRSYTSIITEFNIFLTYWVDIVCAVLLCSYWLLPANPNADTMVSV